MAETLTSLKGLAKRLVDHQIISAEIAEKAQAESKTKHIPLVGYLVSKGLAKPNVVASCASEDFGIPLLDLDTIDPEIIPKDVIDEKLINKHHVLPLYKKGERLYIALSDPSSLASLNEFKFNTGLNTHGILVEEDKLSRWIEKVISAQESHSLQSFEESELGDLEISSEDDVEKVSESETEDAPIVRFVNKVLLDAINTGVSDVHFECYEKLFRIRYRRDGILYETAVPPLTLSARIIARLKVMAQLDISERRLPQDGHFKLKLSRNRSVDFRMNTCPTIGGEKAVLRILDPSSAHVGIEKLGYEEKQRDYFLKAIQKPQGMVLVTGPTGSGKTVSLYTALNILNTEEVNISTVEDPVEINLQGVNQVNVNNKAGLTFSTALRAFLRQDPDIIMVGEIRDLETAEIAVKAAQTGHLVLSTLHTNSAPETLTRLLNMGVPSYNIATSVSLIVAQRLARRLCHHCRVQENIPPHGLMEQGFSEEDSSTLKIFGPNVMGCVHCKSGYSGRVGLYEVMPISDKLGRVIMNGGTAIDILDCALEEGLQTLRRSGLKRVADGTTSLEEINRVTKD